MRISANVIDRGYANYERRRDYTVTLDGAVQTNVITADDELGYILRLKQPLVQAVLTDEWQTEELFGSVVIACG